MKKTTLLLLAASLSLASCKRCWQCTTTTSTNGSTTLPVITQQCEYTRKGIKEVEKNNTYTTTSKSNVIVTTTTCK